MKIRTITTGVNLSYPVEELEIRKTAEFNLRARRIFENSGYEVQTLRVATQPWTEYLGSLSQNQIVAEIRNIEKICINNGIDFLSIGTVNDQKSIDVIPAINKATTTIFATATIGDVKGGINYEAARRAAKAIVTISKTTDSGYGNIRFAALSNCPPDIPFFPASYHQGETCFAIALEDSDLVAKAFEKSGNLIEAEKKLASIFATEVKKVADIAKEIERKEGILLQGIDVSEAPSLQENESIAFAYEKLNLGKFGAPGTLAISGMITEVLQSLDVKKCGYSGLMLPILEDVGLATRCSEGLFGIDNILLYSAVCGTGLDCIPLPGNISEDKIYAILLDMATLSIKLDKPLSARLFPIPNKGAGEIAHFESPYLVDCHILEVK
jgi:uncharacterized protein (UPF0210 family)